MPGHFYPLPPPFIGGRQPYAPELGIPQSGPTPEAPPVSSYAAFESIQSTWLAAAPTFIGGSQAYAPRLGVPQSAPAIAGPPPLSGRNLGIVHSWWTQDVFTTIWLPSIAPLLAVAPPPPRTTLFLSILEAWRPPPYAIPQPVKIAALLATPAVADAPPKRSYSAQIATREAWNFPPPRAQGFTGIAPLVPAAAVADAPLPFSRVVLRSIRESWNPASYALLQGAQIAPLLPVVADAPPPLNRALLYAVRESWTPAPFALPESAQIAPLIQIAAVDVPPRASWANFGTIRQWWEIPPDRVPRTAGRLAPLIPAPVAPDNPPRTTTSRLMSIVRQHDPAQWWALPGYVHLWGSSMFPPAVTTHEERGRKLRLGKVDRVTRLRKQTRKLDS